MYNLNFTPKKMKSKKIVFKLCIFVYFFSLICMLFLLIHSFVSLFCVPWKREICFQVTKSRQKGTYFFEIYFLTLRNSINGKTKNRINCSFEINIFIVKFASLLSMSFDNDILLCYNNFNQYKNTCFIKSSLLTKLS